MMASLRMDINVGVVKSILCFWHQSWSPKAHFQASLIKPNLWCQRYRSICNELQEHIKLCAALTAKLISDVRYINYWLPPSFTHKGKKIHDTGLDEPHIHLLLSVISGSLVESRVDFWKVGCQLGPGLSILFTVKRKFALCTFMRFLVVLGK